MLEPPVLDEMSAAVEVLMQEQDVGKSLSRQQQDIISDTAVNQRAGGQGGRGGGGGGAP